MQQGRQERRGGIQRADDTRGRARARVRLLFHLFGAVAGDFELLGGCVLQEEVSRLKAAAAQREGGEAGRAQLGQRVLGGA